jgi:hypothetical protein
MADNLAINIVADTTKARVELELLNAKLTASRREVKLFRDEANKTGDTTKLTKAVAETERLEKATASLRKETHRAKEEAEGFGEGLLHLAHGNRPVARLIREFGNLSGGIENATVILGRFAGGFAGGIAAMAGLKAWDVLKDQLGEVSKRLAEIKKQAAEMGVKPIFAQGIGETARAAGAKPEDAQKMAQTISDKIDEQLAKGATLGGPRVFTGADKPEEHMPPAGVTIFAGDKKIVADYSDAWKLLNQEMKKYRFPDTEEGKQEKLLKFHEIFLDIIKKAPELQKNIFSKSAFGLPAETTIENAEAQIKGLKARIAELQQSQRGATAPRLAEEHELDIAKARLGDQGEELSSAMANAVRPAQIQITKELADVAEGWSKILSEGLTIDWSVRLTPEVESFLADVEHAWQSFWTEMQSIAQAGADAIVSMLQRAVSAVGAVKSGLATPDSNIAEPFGGGISGTIGGALPADYSSDTGGFAGGGFVRGPGSGTSDSILARLSAGEFVVNSARVRQVGLGFLQRLNGFADGGFVGPAPLRFAAGGLVPSAGGGRAVHLHLGSSSFALSGHDSVVDALVSAAHSQQIRSAGVKPSWFGGRAGGH